MKHEVGEYLIGIVYNVKPYALFLRFEDGSEGLLHISEICDSYIRDIEKYGVVGDQLKVVVISIDPSNGFLRVSYKRVQKEESITTHSNAIRKSPESNKSDFAPLEEKLPEWIEATLKKAKEEENKWN